MSPINLLAGGEWIDNFHSPSRAILNPVAVGYEIR